MLPGFCCCFYFFVVKQKTAYEMRISDWSSDVCSSDPLLVPVPAPPLDAGPHRSYAFQWFAFAAIVAIVYPLILRRVGHRVGEQVDEPTEDVPAGGSPVLR